MYKLDHRRFSPLVFSSMRVGGIVGNWAAHHFPLIPTNSPEYFDRTVAVDEHVFGVCLTDDGRNGWSKLAANTSSSFSCTAQN